MEEKRVSLKLSEKEHTYTASTSYGELPVGEEGYRPMELVLVALAGCMGVDLSHILSKKRQKVQDINITVVGRRRDEHPRVYEDIELEVEVYGEDINPKAVEDAVKLSVEKYCSVYAMLRNSVNIRVRWKVLGKTDSEQK
ncbi:MAG: OsmC family protein [Thermocrinis sp.]|jgi:putative redox protein|nr:OsmC family protein [Thermocrinis sp.]